MSRAFYPYQTLDSRLVDQKQIDKIKQKGNQSSVLDAVDDFIDFIQGFEKLNDEEKLKIAQDKYSGVKKTAE
jgi:hypothetical protein